MVRVASPVGLIAALAVDRVTWALVVDTSNGAADYRHEADALAQYQLLRRAGIPDARIVLAIPDDLGSQVSGRAGGPTLRAQAQVDYHSLGPAAIKDILAGRTTTLLRRVIRSRRGDRVYVYLVGHGNARGIEIGAGPRLTPADVQEALAHNEHASAVVAVEACNSGVFARRVRAPRTVVITATGAGEQSEATRFANGVWHADEFSAALAGALADESLTVRDVWRRVAAQTVGSHVQFAVHGLRVDRTRPLN